jgi:hypothetical protein
MTQMMTQRRETKKEQNYKKWYGGPQANENESNENIYETGC